MSLIHKVYFVILRSSPKFTISKSLFLCIVFLFREIKWKDLYQSSCYCAHIIWNRISEISRKPQNIITITQVWRTLQIFVACSFSCMAHRWNFCLRRNRGHKLNWRDINRKLRTLNIYNPRQHCVITIITHCRNLT